MKNSIRINAFCLLMMMFASCTTIGPEYKGEDSRKEAVQTKEAWSDSSAVKVSPDQVIQKDWWTNFKDPYLNELIEKAISGSFDLKILAGRIEQAGGSMAQSKAGLLPTVNASIGGGLSRSQSKQDDGSYQIQNAKDIKIGGGISWEIDIWGKNKKAYLSSDATHKATEAEYRAGYLKLVSDVAQAYFQLRQIDRQAGMTRGFYEENQKILHIYENQYKAGLIPQKNVLRQEAEVKILKQELMDMERSRKIIEHGIATLLGQPAGELKIPETLSQSALQTVEVPVGLPSDLLSRRPDIIAAEYRVLQAYHQVGVAKAARLPSISLTAKAEAGGGGLVSAALSNLLRTWSLGIVPNISLPIFDGGAGKAKVAVSEAEAKILENTYRKTVMEAFKEVEDALVNLDSRTKQKELLKDRIEDLKKVRKQTQKKLEMGLTSQLEVIDVERELFQAEKAMMDMHRSLLDDNVTLFKALGGGWPKEIVR